MKRIKSCNWIASLTLFSWTSACGVAPIAAINDSGDTSSDDLLGGVVTDRWSSNIGMVINIGNRKGTEFHYNICTGTLVAKGKVLTAAHCVTPINTKGESPLKGTTEPSRLFFVTQTNTLRITAKGGPLSRYVDGMTQAAQKKNSNIYKGTAVHADKDFTGIIQDNDVLYHDIAVIDVDTQYNQSPQSFPQLAEKIDTKARKARVYGYGIAKRNDLYTCNKTGCTLTESQDTEGLEGKRQRANVGIQNYGEFYLQAGGALHGTCHGDSGGPLFINGQLAALTSTGLVNNHHIACSSNNECTVTECVSSGTFSRVDAYMTTIKSLLGE